MGSQQEEREKLPFVPLLRYAETIVTPFFQVPLVQLALLVPAAPVSSAISEKERGSDKGLTAFVSPV